MPLSRENGLGGGRLQREMAALPLPGPAVVIDVRHSPADGTRLIQYVAMELEDLAREMRLNKVLQWRHLADCIDFLRLEAGLPDPAQDVFTDFVITNQAGKTVSMQGQEQLAQYIGTSYLNRVRNSRIRAIQDNGDETREMDFETVSPEQSTVRVFFVTDLEEGDSFTRAVTYANWLKEWSDAYPGPTRTGREELLETVAVCMNANPHRHHELLTQSPSLTALDTVLLIQSYRDDDGFVDENAQIYQAELILYTLLLYWPEHLEITRWRTLDDPDGVQTLPWPTYVVGISALEYSARCGTRWLNYGLAAKILGMLRDARHVQREEKQLQFEVQTWSEDWWQRLRRVVPAALTGVIPSLQAIGMLRGLIDAAPSTQKASPAALIEDLKAFSRQISQFYTGTAGPTLERALESAPLLLWQLEQAYTAAFGNEDGTDSQVNRAYKQLSDLQTQAQLFLLPLFHGAQGALPRAQRQISALSSCIASLRQLEQQSPDLQDYRRQFEQQAEQAQKRMESLLKQWEAWRLRKRTFQREWEEIRRELCQTIEKHLDAVCKTIAASVALAFLQSADLYDASGKPSAYQQRLKRLEEEFKVAQEQAIYEQNLAGERLKFNLEPTQVGAAQASNWFNLNNRRDLLNWNQITDSFLEAHNELQSNSVPLNLLAETILRRLGTEKVSVHADPAQNSSNNRYKQRSPLQAGDQEHFQAVGTLLVAALLSANIDGADAANLLPLLNRYAQLKRYYLTEPTVLDSDVLDVRSKIKEAMLEQALANKGTPGSSEKRALPVAFVMAAWVGSQHRSNPRLSEALTSRGVLEIAGDRKYSPSHAFTDLQRKGKLSGFPDLLTGNDYFYLLLAPGEASDTFLRSLNHLQGTHVRHVYFPDVEKLILLHVHRIRQL